jgi:hypothetical protein
VSTDPQPRPKFLRVAGHAAGSSDDATVDLIERGPLGTPLARGLRALARDADIEAVFRRLGYRLPADRERE